MDIIYTAPSAIGIYFFETKKWNENKNTDENAYICLIANKPADKLYYQFDFDYVHPKSCGMKRKQIKN